MLSDQDIAKLTKVFATKDDFKDAFKNFVTKEDIKNFATKDDLKNFATKDDLKNFATKDDLKNFAMKDDLKNFATKDDLKNFATKDDLKNFATKDDLKDFAKKDDLKNFASKDDLKSFATKTDLQNMTDTLVSKLVAKEDFNEFKKENSNEHQLLFDSLMDEIVRLRQEWYDKMDGIQALRKDTNICMHFMFRHENILKRHGFIQNLLPN